MYKTEQETFWAGEFGNEYTVRNDNVQLVIGDINLFTKIIDRTEGINSIIEFGANIGNNLLSLKMLLPKAEISAIEINEKAAKVLENKKIKIYKQSILDYKMDYQRDLVLIKGVLIHINPDELQVVYQKLYETSQKYIIVAEYYNPTPVTVQYRGHADKLFKRDFAGELMDKYPDLKLIDYGFSYHRDNNFPQDDLNWFLLEKR